MSMTEADKLELTDDRLDIDSGALDLHRQKIDQSQTCLKIDPRMQGMFPYFTEIPQWSILLIFDS